MTKRRIVFVITVVAGLIVGAAMWLLRSSPTPTVALQPSPVPSLVAQAAPSPAAPQKSLPMDERPSEYPQISLKSMSREEASRIAVERLMKDPGADWKVPIDFYGKVIDENNQPVSGAIVQMIWTTFGVPGGSSETQASSDGNGLFSLTKQHGKVLEVRVEKEGYYTVERGGAYVSFEYADPSNPTYYEPEATNPVLFHLRKKGMNAAHLLHWQRDVALNTQNQKALDLKTGQTTQGQSPSLFIEVQQNNGTMGSFTWSASVSVVGGGGVQLETDQFPFLAPTSGYQPSVEMDMTTPKPPYWNGGQGGAFYVQTPEGYGRYTISMALGVPSMFMEGYFNPMPGDQNLEPAAAQR